MPPAFLAAISAACFAGSHIASKRGAQTTSVVGGLLVSLVASWVLLLAVVLLDPPGSVAAGGVALLAGGGLVAPAIGRAANITGIHRLGPSISVSIQTAVYPLFAVTGAVLIRGEQLTWTRALGTVAIVLGVVQLSRRSGATASAVPDGAPPGPRDAGRRAAISAAVAFPILAGLAYGGGDLIRKEAIGLVPHPVFAAFVAVSAALAAWSLAAVAAPRVRARISIGRGAGWFVAGGCLTSAAIIAQLAAFRRGDVSLVSPIVAAQPLLIFLLSALLLRGIERVSVPVLAGGLATVTGVVLITR